MGPLHYTSTTDEYKKRANLALSLETRYHSDVSSYGNYYSEPEVEDAKPEKPKRRNARAKYKLTERGLEVLALYRTMVASAQHGQGGRDALELTQTAWAASHELQPTDAIVMGELASRPQTILELTRSLDDCGVKRPTVEGAIDRLSQSALAAIDAPSGDPG